MHKPVVLVIMDGWGLSPNIEGNVIARAKLPTIQKLNKYYPFIPLQASGVSVGLPWGEMGNSEVGHMVLGAGKVIYHNLPRITLAIQDGSFFQNKAFLAAINNAKNTGGSLHLMGLVGEGAVHSNIEHLHAILRMAKMHDCEKVFVHAFTDGRDSSPTSGIKTIGELLMFMQKEGVGKLASLSGRNWGMDRNNNWDRINKAYLMLTEGAGEKITDPTAYFQLSYAKNVTDEYLEPAILTENGQPVALIEEKDSVIFFNYREDRARQLAKAFTFPEVEGFSKKKHLDIVFATMVEYEKDMPASVAFPPEKISHGLGELLSSNGKKQLRIAETEKYAHVTYFFNGGREDPFPGEDRVVIPSPDVAKFDEAPEMSAAKLTDEVLTALKEKDYDFILINYANPDMVGHTGNEKASVLAVEFIDKCLERLIPEVLRKGGCLLITADHGNVEEVKNLKTGGKDTEHSSNPVPLWFVTPENHRETPDEISKQIQAGGLLGDVAPTVLDIMQIEKPASMTGESLLPLLK